MYNTAKEDIFYDLLDTVAVDEQWLEILYIISALFFTMAIFGFRDPASAPVGNLFAMIGMAIAIFGTIGSSYVYDYGYWIFIGVFAACGLLGAVLALTVKMTAMPQMVGLLNAFGGLSAALESFSLYTSPIEEGRQNWEWDQMNDGIDISHGRRYQVYNSIFYCLGMVIGLITFTGSSVACLKLAELKGFKGTMYIPMRNVVTTVLLIIIAVLAAVGAAAGVGNTGYGLVCFIVSACLASLYGILFVMAIGGADMPVVISVLNSLSGWSTVFAGLTFRNSVMIISGAFVGASGIILSFLMCKAMNRSLTNVLMGSIGGGKKQEAVAHLDAHLADAEMCARYLAGSKNVMIIPGYGMAVSRAQHNVASLADELNKNGRTCRFAIHPVAGRLPGHMNVLLAEANVPYDTFDDLEDANNKFKDIDTAIVIGANDTVNPSAVFDKNSPIYGMPVLQCWEAKRTIVIKRSLNQGYAGIDNPLFFSPNTSMLLGDGCEVVKDLLNAFCAKAGTVTPDQISPTTIDFMKLEENRVNMRVEEQKKLVTVEGGTSDSCSEVKVNPMIQDNPNEIVIGVLKEPEGDYRVAIIPKDVSAMLNKPWNAKIIVQSGAGEGAGHSDSSYKACGASIGKTEEDVIEKAHIIVKIAPPTDQQVELADRNISMGSKVAIPMELSINNEVKNVEVPGELKKPMFLCCFGNPSGSKETQELCADRGVSFLSMDIMPRVTAAQAMDVLSSSAKVAGYRSVLEATYRYGKLTSPEITAAGSYPPAKVLVVGCGVAGLQAIGDFHRMGADVRAFDVRKECADQVVSMGGRFLFLNFEEDGAGAGGYANIMSDEFIAKEMELFLEQAKECDIFVLTAAIPGRRAPILLKSYHVDAMKRGSVVVDIAAPTGGNCESTRPGENYTTHNGVIMVGKVDFVSTISAPISSEMLSANVMNWFGYNYSRTNCLRFFDSRDNISRAIVLTHDGRKCFPPPRPPAPPAPKKSASVKSEDALVEAVDKTCASFGRRHSKCFNSTMGEWLIVFILALLAILLALTAPEELVTNLMALILGSWTGFLLIKGVSSSLYTPLMSLTNAISGVVLLAAILGVSPSFNDSDVVNAQCANDDTTFYCVDRGMTSIILNGLAIAAASMNVVGGFAVTHRMLGMFTSR